MHLLKDKEIIYLKKEILIIIFLINNNKGYNKKDKCTTNNKFNIQRKYNHIEMKIINREKCSEK